MTDADIDILKTSQGKEVKIRCTDGEVMEIRVLSVSELEGDIVYDLVSTTRPERYAGQHSRTSYLTPFNEIDSVASWPNDAAPQIT